MQNNQKTAIEHLFYSIIRTKIRKTLKKYFFLDTERFILQADKEKRPRASASILKGVFNMRKSKSALMGYLKVISFIVLIGMAEPVASLLIR